MISAVVVCLRYRVNKIRRQIHINIEVFALYLLMCEANTSAIVWSYCQVIFRSTTTANIMDEKM